MHKVQAHELSISLLAYRFISFLIWEWGLSGTLSLKPRQLPVHLPAIHSDAHPYLKAAFLSFSHPTLTLSHQGEAEAPLWPTTSTKRSTNPRVSTRAKQESRRYRLVPGTLTAIAMRILAMLARIRKHNDHNNEKAQRSRQ